MHIADPWWQRTICSNRKNGSMIEIRGPSNNHIYIDEENWDNPQTSPAYFCEAITLGEALEKYCKEFGSSIRPYITDPPIPPFAETMVYDDPLSRFRDVVVRISIERGGELIAEPYGLDYHLHPGDRINFGAVGC